MTRKIIKTTGDVEAFSIEKLQDSLERVGFSRDMAQKVAHNVAKEQSIRTTVDVHKKTYEELKKKHRPVAARYNLKRALLVWHTKMNAISFLNASFTIIWDIKVMYRRYYI